jgi:hypothetical protein
MPQNGPTRRCIHRAVSAASFHVLDLDSLADLVRWRMQARRRLPRVPGLRFHRVMGSLGTRASAGFSIAGFPDAKRVVVFLVWDDDAAREAFWPEIRRWDAACRFAWHMRAHPLEARGSHHGVAPLADAPLSSPARRSTGGGPVAVLTLGRTRLSKMLIFARISPPAGPFLASEGLAHAVSAGLPVKGNCTLTLWESEDRMLSFAYGRPGDHSETLRRNRARSVLVEQLSGRFAPTRIEGSWDPRAPNAEALAQLAAALR